MVKGCRCCKLIVHGAVCCLNVPNAIYTCQYFFQNVCIVRKDVIEIDLCFTIMVVNVSVFCAVVDTVVFVINTLAISAYLTHASFVVASAFKHFISGYDQGFCFVFCEVFEFLPEYAYICVILDMVEDLSSLGFWYGDVVFFFVAVLNQSSFV